MKNNKQLEQLYLQYKNSIYNFIMRLANDPDVAMDITQQTFLMVLSDNSNQAISKSWCISIARNLFYQEININNKISLDSIDQSIELNFSDDQFNAIPIRNALKILQSKIEVSITQMSIATRELMILYFIENLSIIEIAAITRRSIVDVKVSLYDARINFEKSLIKKLKGKVIASNDYCLAYKRMISWYGNADFSVDQLNMINMHISNCNKCSNEKQQLKRIALLINLTPIIKTPKSLDEKISAALEIKLAKTKSQKQMSKSAGKLSSKITNIVVYIFITGVCSVVLYDTVLRDSDLLLAIVRYAIFV